MATFTAAICEDEEKILDYLTRKLDAEFRKTSMDFAFDSYINGEELLCSISRGKEYALYFLDIEMPEINGIELCRRIRQIKSEALVVFISNKEELVFQSFEVRPFRFIRKSHFHEELPKLISDLCAELIPKKKQILTIHEQKSSAIYSLDISQILYIEAFGRYCKVMMTDQELSVRYAISDFEKELAPFGFLQVHRSYLVNYRFIFTIGTDTLALDNRMVIPVSRRRAEEIRRQFMKLSREDLS